MLPLVAAAAKLIGSASVRTIARRLGAKFVDKTKKEILEAISKAQTKKARDAIRGASKVKAKDPKGDIAKGVRAERAQAGQFSRDTKGSLSIKPKKRKALGSRDVIGDKEKNKVRSPRTKYNPLKPDKKKQKAAEMEKRQREMADKSNKRKAKRKAEREAKSRALTVVKDPKTNVKSTAKKETATTTTTPKKKSKVTSFKDYVRKNPKKTAAGVIGGAAAVGYVATRGKKKGSTPVKSNGSSSSNNSHIKKSTPNKIGKPKKYNYMGTYGGIRVGVRKK